MNLKDVKVESYPPPHEGEGMSTGKISVGVRVTHVPSGTSIVCDLHRHMHKNREEALEILSHIIDHGA